MIRLTRLKKTYHARGIARFDVTNDVSLLLPDAGFVFILGASGSGKTTLLNVMSGMDSFDSGTVEIDGEVLAKKDRRRFDEVRRRKIGYVHQNYHLLKERTVQENIEPVLRMQGIADAGAIRNAVLGLLSAVGLSAYADRLVRQLSGGQQQRVAVARALANDPRVILADEPSGNLDRKTTIGLMNLIAAIAKTRLVVMVTHDRSLSAHYADRVIEIENGAIVKDEKNVKTPAPEFSEEHVVHLGELKKTSAVADGLRVNRYVSADESEPIGVDLVEKNRTLYLKIRSGAVRRMRTIGLDGDIELREGSRADDPIEPPLDLAGILPQAAEGASRKVFSWRDVFRFAATRLRSLRGSGKLLLFVLGLVGTVVAVSIGLIGEVYRVEEPYRTIDSHYVSITMTRTSYAALQELESVEGVDQLVLYNEPFRFRIDTGDHYELRSSVVVEAMPIDIRFLDPTLLIAGSVPDGYGVVVDRSVADAIIRDNAERGIDTYEDVLGCSFKLQTSGIDIDVSADSALLFPITGIADAKSKSVWMAEELTYSLIAPVLVDYRVLGEEFRLVSGEMPDIDTFLLLNDHHPTVRDGGVPYSVGIDYGIFYVAGVYAYEVDGVSWDFGKTMVTTLDFIKSRFYGLEYGSILDFRVYVYAEDVETALANLRELGYDAEADVYDESVARALKLEENRNIYLLGLGGLLMSAFSILLVMRSSLIKRMYEIGVYRGIGVTRREIRRIFTVEILATTTLSSVVGFALAAVLLGAAGSSGGVSVTHFTVPLVAAGIVGLYLVNLGFGLIPVAILLHKSPAEIMRQSDI